MASIVVVLMSGQAFASSTSFIGGTVNVEGSAILDMTETAYTMINGTVNVAGTLKLKASGNSVSGSGTINILEDVVQDDSLKNDFSEIIGEKTAYSVTSATVEGNADDLGDMIKYPENSLDLGKSDYRDVISKNTNFINLVSENTDKKVTLSGAPDNGSSLFALAADLGSLGADGSSVHPMDVEVSGYLTFESNTDNYEGTIISKPDQTGGHQIYFKKDGALPNIYDGEPVFYGTQYIPAGRTVNAYVGLNSEAVLTVKSGATLKLM